MVSISENDPTISILKSTEMEGKQRRSVKGLS
jgi:hypothetical protein